MRYSRHILSLIVFLAAGTALLAQSNTMYYLRNVPQAYYLNPAIQPQPNVFIGAPVLSTSYFDLHHNSIGMSDFFWNDPNSDQVLHPLTSADAMSEFLAKLGDANNITSELDFNLASFGFRVKDLYLMFDVTSRTNAGLKFPNELANFLIQGNEDGQEFHFSNMGFYWRDYVEVGVGASYKIGDMITVGVRPKLLLGVASISSWNNDIRLSTSHDMWQLDSYLEMQMATPGIIFPVDAQGNFDPTGEITLDTALTALVSSSSRDTILPALKQISRGAAGNKGFGIDFGVNITPMEELTISLSVIDLGSITWNNYAYSADLESSFEFEGIEYNSSDNTNAGEVIDELSDTSSFGGGIIDTLLSHFNATGGASSFTTRLTPKVYVGASYSILPSVSFGMLARFDFPESGFEYDLMLHANYHPTSYFALSLSYSPFKGGASTFGLGASFRSGPISYYAVADYNSLRYTLFRYEGDDFISNEEGVTRNYPVMLSADNRTAFNIRFGINLVFGWNQRKKLMQDKPMYFSKDY
ncbi:MAG: hypothetical protein JW801_08530 [Bacteroidales bacterium]|nr:hypothetical protein [Bacteroidales bacterium]